MQGLVTAGIPQTGAGGLYDTTEPVPGVWEMGVACTLGAVVQDVWSTKVTFNTTGSGVNMTIGSYTVVPETPLTVGLPLAGVAAVAGVVGIRRRRARRSANVAAA